VKKVLLTLSVAISVGLILLAITVPVNHSRLLPTWNSGTIQADGVPAPPPIIPPKQPPPKLVADGVPAPPPIIPPKQNPPKVIAGWTA